MSLKTIFQSRDRQFKDAIRANDIAHVEKMLDAGYAPDLDRSLNNRESPFSFMCDKSSLEMLAMFVRKSSVRLNSFTASGSPATEMAKDFVITSQLDRLQVLLDANVNFNGGWYAWHPLNKLFQRYDKREIDKDKALALVEAMAAGGLERVGKLSSTWDTEFFVYDAIRCNLPEALDIAAKRGLDLRGNEEQALRWAAQFENEDMCRYLIEHYKADVTYAKVIAAKTGDSRALYFLTYRIIGVLPPVEVKAATIESLSAEVKALRETVAELTQTVIRQNDPNRVIKLDKSGPKPEQP